MGEANRRREAEEDPKPPPSGVGVTWTLRAAGWSISPHRGARRRMAAVPRQERTNDGTTQTSRNQIMETDGRRGDRGVEFRTSRNPPIRRRSLKKRPLPGRDESRGGIGGRRLDVEFEDVKPRPCRSGRRH